MFCLGPQVLVWGNEPGQSSLIEVVNEKLHCFDLVTHLNVFEFIRLLIEILQGFTAGGFIYIAVAGVLAEMNNSGKSTLKNSACHMISLILGMSVALCISLLE